MLEKFRSLEAITHRDPGGRGVASLTRNGQWFDVGQLEQAARSLANDGRHVAIVTGFCIPRADPPAAETDGPPGALVLARFFIDLDLQVSLISDRYGLPLLRSGCESLKIDDATLIELPLNATRDEVDSLMKSSGRDWSHLLAIERCGPSHTHESLKAQGETTPEIAALFDKEVPAVDRDVCHNMRGVNINAYNAPTHFLFEAVGRLQSPIKTIGIADGGNEIGMGCVPWRGLRDAIRVGPAACVACRVRTDHLLLAGVSNWGGYALAASVAAMKNRFDLIESFDVEQLRRLIETIVYDAGAVDGVTARREATVDGLPLEEELGCWGAIRSTFVG